LLNNVVNSPAPLLKVSSLEALGYMCDAMEPGSVGPEVVNQILSAIIHGVQPSGPDAIRQAALLALINSLEFVDHNFEVEAERDAIMQTVCEATQAQSEKIRESAYECLTKVAELYYDKLSRYVQTIYTLSTGAIRSDTEKVAMKALDFWQTVCECEVAVLEDREDGDTSTPYLQIAEAATPTLLPILLETLTKQPEVMDSYDSRVISIAGSECLGALARVAKDMVVGPTVAFISSNLGNPNWRLKEASINAFGAIMVGPKPETLYPIIQQALAPLVNYLQDQSCVQVRATTAWTLARICEYHKDAIPGEALQPMVNALLVNLEDKKTNVASQACYAIHNLALACADQNEAPSNLLSVFITQMLHKLFMLAARDDADEDNLRINAYEAIGMIVENSAMDVRPLIVQVCSETLNRLEASFGAPSLDANERSELQGNLCGLIGHCVQKLETAEVTPLADRIMGLLIQVFGTKGAHAHEDAFLVVGFLADKLSANFNRYVPHIIRFILAGLKNYEEYQVCTMAVACVNDICRAVGPQILPHCDDIVRHLLELLQAPSLHKSVKPHALSCFADIAMAINGDFERYSNIVLVMLKQVD
jgi:importin subunit beta-1